MRVKLSQNFLKDRGIAAQSVEGLKITKNDIVLEIGPGKGILTRLLLEQAKEVIAVEIDPNLHCFLQHELKSYKNLILLQGDFLELPWSKIVSNQSKVKIIGNLPYAVVSPILQKILAWDHWTTLVVMVQKEVGERILSQSGSKKYGILSISVQTKAYAEKLFSVSKNCFKPVPQVESSILRFFPLKHPLIEKKDEEHFFKVVRAAFMHRRKTILNSLKNSLNCSAEILKSVLVQSQIFSERRAETLSLEEFKNLSLILQSTPHYENSK
ncbi:MAG: ribosomal RNA small subunit methyltransferase A [Elusimicrobia bacterium]|nr:ribosomal RNA small subunit methyltransferase A [Elusimicrobiota bacterium]